ncbi:hypothetical protein COY25_02310 [Candidatus Uhrbacteria bacterium CG_4_10_14_0_2_um_filter_41_7]|uniref:DDH domain-containing protein n=1 Tax=Candidatus Uhrbacteria bacterium CG_4_9_14_3_um_filter_41_35 TaxID=1975034 RepID=A0A2M7XGT6_9BACT|nr:MAG: hypothetical protein COV92_00535 [Candidatus Uhrbacteria bacterium CG11_big_fil_rev_8_21_14_0_20_41_9]PIZ54262.1 MAG: hypothetical protein COY25_02310 [Candidatus Uhrbacteria bacterium CG_4_10_14_0_2_um_filter_41_7]PJA47081.1 MAG: hypothetical protein CO173_00250 [Candidatus Uhrbacteria bacterium CG_4_9_14_3_um_filter_41_35]
MNFLHKQVKDLVDGACRILLLTDERIDGDTIGSTLGMYHVLRQAGKDVRVYSPKSMVDTLQFMPGVEVIERDELVFIDGEFDLIIIFDCSDGQYFKDHLPKMNRQAPLIVFDHHHTNPRYGTVNVVEPEAASSADVTWRFVKLAGYLVNKDAAQCFLTGIITDTNIFSTSNTNEACLIAAKELVSLGAKLNYITQNTFGSRPVPTLKLWGVALERLHYNQEFDALVTMITRKDMERLGVGDEEADTKALSNMLNLLSEGQDAVMVLRESKDGGVNASLRSQNRSVARLAEKYGGGGHEKAAGFRIENARLIEKDGQWFIDKVA